MDISNTTIGGTPSRVQDTPQKLLLIDCDDARRQSRVQMLESVGYEVATRTDYIAAERADHEGQFDLIIVTCIVTRKMLRHTPTISARPNLNCRYCY